jgi:NDP-sugar pyrophosphorylase family protein
MDTFFHKFGMFEEAPARRWVNPDRSEGAIVATSATVDPYTHLPHQTVVGPHARIGAQASIGEGVSIASHAQVGDRVSFGTGVSVGGHTIVNDDCRIGERASLEGAWSSVKAFRSARMPISALGRGLVDTLRSMMAAFSWVACWSASAPRSGLEHRSTS